MLDTVHILQSCNGIWCPVCIKPVLFEPSTGMLPYVMLTLNIPHFIIINININNNNNGCILFAQNFYTVYGSKTHFSALTRTKLEKLIDGRSYE